MKLRIAHVDDERRTDGRFAVQKRSWGRWHNMYLNCDTKVLKESIELGDGHTVNAIFDDFHDAMRYARIFKQKSSHKQIIRETWRV